LPSKTAPLLLLLRILKGGGQNHWSKQNPPNDGESEIKTVALEGAQVTVKYCRRCRRWTKGEKAHCSAEHKTRAELEQQGSNGNHGNSGNSGTIGGFLGTGVTFVGNLGYSAELAGQEPCATTDFLHQLYEDYTAFASDVSTDIVPPDQVDHVMPIRPLSERCDHYDVHVNANPKGPAGRD
jgi:hypothetical protein